MPRADGKRLKTLEPFFQVVPYIMDKRNDATNLFHDEIPMKAIDDYLKAKRQEGVHISHMALLITAWLHVVAEKPQLNRFVVNKRIYKRNHLCVAITILKQGHTETTSPTVVKLFLDGTENVFQVSEKLEKLIADNVQDTYENAMDKLLYGVFKVPGLVSAAVHLFKFADRHGLLPRSAIDALPFHTSLFITNLASLRANSIFHHLYNFGTTSLFIAMGTYEHRLELNKEGKLEEVKYMPLGISCDERIAEGDYYAASFHKLQQLLRNPELLEQNVTPVPDVD